MTMYIGKVTKILEDNSAIYFTIPNISTIPVIAYPMVELSRVPVVDDEIFILQPEDDVALYYYMVSPTEEHTKEIVLRYKDVKMGIDLTADDGEGMVNIVKVKDGQTYSLSDMLEKLINYLKNFRVVGNSSAQTTEQSLRIELQTFYETYIKKFIGGLLKDGESN